MTAELKAWRNSENRGCYLSLSKKFKGVKNRVAHLPDHPREKQVATMRFRPMRLEVWLTGLVAGTMATANSRTHPLPLDASPLSRCCAGVQPAPRPYCQPKHERSEILGPGPNPSNVLFSFGGFSHSFSQNLNLGKSDIFSLRTPPPRDSGFGALVGVGSESRLLD